MVNILKEIGMILRTQGKESNPLLTVASSVSTMLSLNNGDTIINPYNIVNTFNNLIMNKITRSLMDIVNKIKRCKIWLNFASMAETMKKA